MAGAVAGATAGAGVAAATLAGVDAASEAYAAAKNFFKFKKMGRDDAFNNI